MSASGHEYASIVVTCLPIAQRERMRLLFYYIAVDVYFKFTDSTKIPANKTILSLYSEAFQKMFFGETRQQKEFVMLNVLPQDFRLFLDATIGITSLGVAQALTVFPLAEKYEVETLKDTCEQIFEIENLEDYIIQTLDIGIAFNSERIINSCMKTIRRKGPVSVFTEPNIFPYLTPRNLEVILRYFPPTSKELVQALFVWADHMRKPGLARDVRSLLKSWNVWSLISFENFNVLELTEFMETDCVRRVFSEEERAMVLQRIYMDKLNISFDPTKIVFKAGDTVTEVMDIPMQPPKDQFNLLVLMYAPIEVSTQSPKSDGEGSIETISVRCEPEETYISKPLDLRNRVDVATYDTFGINSKRKVGKQLSLDPPVSRKNFKPEIGRSFSVSAADLRNTALPEKPMLPPKPIKLGLKPDVSRMKPQGTALRISARNETSDSSRPDLEMLPGKVLKDIESNLRLMLESSEEYSVPRRIHSDSLKETTATKAKNSYTHEENKYASITTTNTTKYIQDRNGQKCNNAISVRLRKNRRKHTAYDEEEYNRASVTNRVSYNHYTKSMDKDLSGILTPKKGQFSNRCSIQLDRKLLPPPPPPPPRNPKIEAKNCGKQQRGDLWKLPYDHGYNSSCVVSHNVCKSNPSRKNEIKTGDKNIYTVETTLDRLSSKPAVLYSPSRNLKDLPKSCVRNNTSVPSSSIDKRLACNRQGKGENNYLINFQENLTASTYSLPPSKPERYTAGEHFPSIETSFPFPTLPPRDLIRSQTSFKENSKTALRKPSSCTNVVKFEKPPEGNFVECVVCLVYRDEERSTKEVRLSRFETLFTGNCCVFRYLEALDGSLIHCIDKIHVEYRFKSRGIFVKHYPPIPLTTDSHAKLLTKAVKFE